MTHTAKHTPGPWYPHYAKADHCLSSSVWGQEPGNQVAVIGGKSLETMNANASLIAAAPAMYEALKALHSVLDQRMPDGRTLNQHLSREVFECFYGPAIAARAAIAKAEGA